MRKEPHDRIYGNMFMVVLSKGIDTTTVVGDSDSEEDCGPRPATPPYYDPYAFDDHWWYFMKEPHGPNGPKYPWRHEDEKPFKYRGDDWTNSK